MTPKKPIFRFFSSTILAATLFFGMSVAFTRFTQTVLAEEEGTPYCKTIPAGCGSFGCNGNPGSYTCSLYAEQPGATCTSGGPCTTGPGGLD